MPRNIICSAKDTENGWILSVMNPDFSETKREHTSEFYYTVQRSSVCSDNREIHDIHMTFCPDLSDLDITDCLLEVTYQDTVDIKNSSVTIVFSNLCEVEYIQSDSECLLLLFEQIPSGDEAIGGDYIQEQISIRFLMNKKIWTEPMKMILKSQANTMTWVVCGFLRDQISGLSNNEPKSIESIAAKEVVLAHVITMEGLKMQVEISDCDREGVINAQADFNSESSTPQTIFKMKSTLTLKS